MSGYTANDNKLSIIPIPISIPISIPIPIPISIPIPTDNYSFASIVQPKNEDLVVFLLESQFPESRDQTKLNRWDGDGCGMVMAMAMAMVMVMAMAMVNGDGDGDSDCGGDGDGESIRDDDLDGVLWSLW